MTMQLGSTFDFSKTLRILLIAAMLTVGSLQVTNCGGTSSDVEQAARDQYNRMNQ